MVSFILQRYGKPHQFEITYWGEDNNYCEASSGDAKCYHIRRDMKTSELEDVLLTAACRFSDDRGVKETADLLLTHSSGRYARRISISIKKGNERFKITSSAWKGLDIDELEIEGKVSTKTVDAYVKSVKEMILGAPNAA